MSEIKLGARIAELRNKRSITQTDLAKILEMSHSTVAMWETGKRDPDSKMITKLANFFNVSSDYLLGLTDDSSAAYPQLEYDFKGEKDEDGNYQVKIATSIPQWATPKDVRDFKKFLEQDADIMFDGVPMTEEAKQRIIGYVEAMFWDAKKQNKLKKTDR